jgi:hypothetical protein
MQTLQIQMPTAITKRDAYLLELRGLGLDPTVIGWRDGLGHEAMQHLESIVAWVRRWQVTGGNREQMARQGFAYPPVVPDCNPEQDWYCFSRWINRLPLIWRYESDFGPLPEADALTDEQLDDLLNVIVERLESRGVNLVPSEGLPDRECYRWLREELRTQPIDFLGAETVLTLDGCTGDCESCFQRNWCALADESLDPAAAG